MYEKRVVIVFCNTMFTLFVHIATPCGLLVYAAHCAFAEPATGEDSGEDEDQTVCSECHGTSLSSTIDGFD